MNDNIQKLYGALQKNGYNDLGTAEEFGTKVQDEGSRRKLYDALSRDGFNDLGTFEEFSGRLVQDAAAPAPAQSQATAVVPATKQEQSSDAEAVAREERRKNAAEGWDMFNRMRESRKPATSPVQVDMKRPEASEEPEANPFPYRGELQKELEDLRERRMLAEENVKPDLELISEYDRRLKEFHKSLDPTSKKTKENEKWLREHKDAYEAAKNSDNMKEYASAKAAYDETARAMGNAREKIAERKNREEMASPAEVVATGKTALGNDNIGRKDTEYMYRKLADELYQSADKEYDWSSKNDEGYKGGPLDQLWTATKQFVSDAGNNIDSGSLTFGASKGIAMEKAREVGEKYNGIITDTLKGMKMSDGDIKAVLSSIEMNGEKLQALDDEMKAASSELDAMASTYEDMVKRGDPDAEAYGKSLQEKIDAYNKRINEEYKPLFARYDGDRKAYEQVMSAIDAAVENGLSGGEKALLDALERFTEAKMLSEPVRSTASKAGAGAEQSAEFMLDFILTGGIAKAGTKAATKLATKRALKKYGAEVLKDMAVKPGLGLRLATDAAVSGLRTAAVFPRTLQAYGENATEYSGKDLAGRIDFDRTQANALGNSLLTQFIEYWSEGFGEYFGEAEQALFKSVTKQAPKEMIGKTLRNYRGSIGQYLDKGKFDGMFNEMLEEVVGSGLNSLSGWLSGDRVGDADAMKEFFSGENIATLALSFLPMSAISAATNVSAYHKMKKRYDEGVAMLNPFIESGAISRGELEKLSKDIPNLTPNEVKDRIVEIADHARGFNEGHLPKDFAKNLIGYLEGDFAMNLRNDEWEDSREKMSVVESYSSTYANPNPRYAWDLSQLEAETRTAAEEAGFTQDDLDLDSYQLAQEAKEIRDTDPDRAEILLNYANAKAAAQGLDNGFREQGEQIAQANDEEIRSTIDVNGSVIPATVTEYGVPRAAFILSDDVTVAPDGTISTPTGNGVVRYRIFQNGEYGPESTIMADKVSGAQTIDTESYIGSMNAAMLDGRNELYETAKKTVSPDGQSRSISRMVGMNVVIRGNGAYQPVRVERMTDDGMKVVISGDKDTLKGVATAAQVQTPGGKYLEIDVTRLWPLLDKEADGLTLTTFDPKSNTGTTETTPTQAQTPQINPDELQDTEQTIMLNGQPTKVTVTTVGGDGVWFTYKDAAGNDVEGDMPLENFMDSIVTEETPAATDEVSKAPAPAQEQAFPVDEKGNRVFDHPDITPERAYRELMDGIEPGSKNEANRVKYINAKAAKAAKDVADAENKIAGIQARRDAVDGWDIKDDEEIDAFEQRKATEKKKFDDEIAQIQEQMTELQRKAAHWASIRDMASAVASVREALERDARLVSRADNWSSRTGVRVRIFRAPDEVDDKSAKAEIERGERVNGWYNPKTGEVGLYLPNLADETEVDKTFIHEVVSHKGLRELLGKENYDSLCDKVWDQLMSQAERDYWKDEYNGHLKDKGYSEEFLRRAAADEWIAHFSEGLGLEGNKNIFDKFVEFVKEFIDKILGEDAKITKEDIESLLRSSLANYETRRNEMRAAELSNLGIAANGEDTRFSVRYVPTQDEVGHIAKDISTTMGIPEDQARKWLESEMSLAAIITGYQEFLDYKADDRYTAIKNDSDYPQGTVDFNNICRKRLDFTEMYQRIQRAFPNTIITGEDLATIRNIMKKHGLTVACGLCYVEDRRQLLGEIAKDFIDNLAGNFKRYESRGGETKKKNAEKFRSLIGDDRKEDLSIYDLITLDGSTRLNEEHPGIYKAFQAFNAARGQQAGNLFQGYAEYKHEILNWSDAKVRRVNDNGGLRIFSYSDFEAHHLIDIVQIVIDCARRGVKIQGYTKVPAFARAVANTGIKLNRSLIPLGDTGIADGKLAYDPVEGIDIDDPDFLESNDNIGNILIGINDEQIRLAMADPFVHYIIPYHSNQSGVLRGMKQTGKWTNYKNEQTEKGENVGKHGVNIYTDVLNAAEAEGKPITNEREFTERFLAVCKEKGWTPRFARFLNTNEAGDYVYTPGYYKLLLDFKLFDENGNILPQTPVVAEFDDAFNAKILMDYVAEQEERKTNDLDPVYDEIVEALDLEDRTAESIDDGGTRFRKVEDPAKIEELESGPKVKVYRSMQFVPDPNGDVEYDLGDGNGLQKGFLYAPMSAKVDGKWRDPIRLGVWEEAEENPDMADENGEFILDKGDGSGPMKVAYAPYLHTRRSPLNEQFSSAYKRGNLIIVESEIPESELSSNYTADKSKKSTGEHDWPSGKVSNALAKKGMDTRKVILSRWAKPVRLVPNSEVADEIVKLLGNSRLSFPYNVVTPGLRAELKDRGVRFKGWQGNKPKNVDELIAGMERADEGNVRFRKANQTQNGFISNAEAALDRIKMEKATPEQWAKMLEKEGGLKAGEDKWLGLSDWLMSQDKKSITKQDVADYIAEHRIQIEEVKYSGSLKDDIQETIGRGRDLSELQEEIDGIKESDDYQTIGDAWLRDEFLRDEMKERYGEDFEMGYSINNGEVDYNVDEFSDMEYRDNYSGPTRPINDVRLGYTTEGLDNKREIALTVPAIEPWNQGDDIHFGDAGEGRAVAWIRFGDAVSGGNGKLALEELERELANKYHCPPYRLRELASEEDIARLDAAREAVNEDYRNGISGKKVLVIDEIQSKRHQEGREKGYVSADLGRLQKELDELRDEYNEYTESIEKKYGQERNLDEVATPEELQKAKDYYAREKELRERVVEEKMKGSIPVAPFEKNWHELAMKRMLRLAAEEGYDYVAWTTGDQQADRYNMESAIGKIYASKDGDKYYVEVYDPQGKEITFNGLIGDSRSTGTYTAEELVNIFGKEGAKEIVASVDALPSNEEVEKLREKAEASGEKEDRDAWRKASHAEIDGSELFKGEGMKGFYDDILPRFMNKYGKKWGVKVSDITLPNVEKAGHVMHAVPVTQEMKDSVMEGQTMFRKVITPEQDKEYMDAVNSGNMDKAQEMVDATAEATEYTIEGYHGTTHNFTIFDRSRGNAEGNWGKGFYFTNNEDDANANYANEEGADLTNRIEILAEQMEWMDGYEDMDYDQRREKAREILAGDNPHVISAAIRMENPLILDSRGGQNETFFDYDSGYNEETDEYEEEESGLLVDFANAWNDVMSDWEWEGNNVTPAEVLQYAEDGGLTASQLEEKAREVLDQAGVQNQEGELATGEFLRQVFERMGFDGIVDNNVNFKFGTQRRYGRGMDGVDYGTAHIIAFTPEQIKQTDPVTYDDAGNVIPLSERFNPENNDIRFRVSNDVDVRSTSANLYDAYENQNGDDKPWMSEQELIDRIEDELPYGIDTKGLFAKIDEYRRLDDEDFDEGRRDFSGSEMDAVFQEILSGLKALADAGQNDSRFRKEEKETAERFAEAERFVTEKILDSMPQAIGAGVMRVSQKQMPDGHKTDKGYYNPETNTVSVCMENVLDERDAVATVIHETVGWKGLREIFGDQYRESMASSYAALDAEGRAWVNGYMLRNGLRPGDEGILRGMEEYMASRAGVDGGSFMDSVNDILSQAVDLSVGTEGFRFTNRELAYILRASYEHLKNPGWLDTPAGKAQDTLWKREYGINESDPNRPTDPDGPDAGTRFRRGDTGNAARDYERDMKDWHTAAVMEMQNADLPVRIGYEKALKEKYGDKWNEKMKSLPENQDYLMRHNLSSSRADTENHNFKLFHFDPMLEKVKEVRDKLPGGREEAYERVLDYLYAVSGLERNEWERNNGGEAKDWSGLTSLMGRPKEEWQEAEADARSMVDAFENEVNDKKLLDELWDAIRSCTDFSLDHAYKYGLLAKDEYERLRGTEDKPRLWNYYLPLRGFVNRTAEEEYNYAGLVGSSRDSNEVVKDAKGRWTEADNPLAYIANIAQKEIVQGNENWARQALYRFATNLGENSLLSVRKPWYVKDDATGKWKLAEPEENQDIEAFEADMKAKKEKGEARQGRKGLDLGLIMANEGHRNQHLIHVRIGGEDRMIWVNGNPALARAVSGAGRQPNWTWFRAAGRIVSNTFTTYSLDFTAKNLLRDSIYSRMAMLAKEDRRYRHKFEKNWWLNGGFTALPMIRLAALWDSGELQRKPASERTPKEQLFIDFMTDGGQTGYTIVRNVEKIKKEMEKVMNPSLARRVIDGAKVKVAGVDVPILGIYTWGVRTMNEAFELLTRFTAYETSREVGRSGQRAAYDAKEISVNFNRRGAQSNEGFWGQLAAFFGGTHYFFNAGVQGFDNFLRLYKTSPKTMTAESVALMLLGFVTPIINALVSGGGDGDDDKKWYNTDWYWNLPEWVRRNNIVLGRPEEEKVDENGNIKRKKGASYLCIPLPVEFRALYGLGDITNSVFLSHTYANPSPGPGDWSSIPTPGNVFLDILSTASGILPVNPIEGYNGKSVDFKDAVMRSLVPDLFIFGVDWMTNQDYTGRQLKKENMFTPHVPASQGAYTSTPKALVEAAQWMGEHYGVDVAPGVVRDFLSNYGGGFYKFAEDLSKRMFTDDDHPKRWDDIPFLSGFTGHIDEDRTITYVNNILNEYKDVSENVVKKMNLYSNSKDINAKQAFTEEDTLPDKAKIQKLMAGKDYQIARIYYLGMEDEHTGEKERGVKVHKTGKSAGKQYRTTQEIKIPGVKSRKKAWQDAREAWKKEKKGTPEEAQAYMDVTNAWHEYYNAAADLAQKLMDFEYEGKTE